MYYRLAFAFLSPLFFAICTASAGAHLYECGSIMVCLPRLVGIFFGFVTPASVGGVTLVCISYPRLFLASFVCHVFVVSVRARCVCVRLSHVPERTLFLLCVFFLDTCTPASRKHFHVLCTSSKPRCYQHLTNRRV